MFIISCKQKERIVREEYDRKITEAELERMILSKNNDIKTIKLNKVNFSVDFDGEEFKSGGTIAILKDSVIIVSLIPIMGYEISRIFCYKDTIIVLDRLEKTFFYTSLKKNMNRYHISGDYYDIEAILTGRAFIYGDEKFNSGLKRNIQKEDNYIKLYYEILEKDFLKASQEVRVREDLLLTENNNILDTGNKIEISIDYNQFKSIKNVVLPHEIGIRVSSSQNKLDFKIDAGNISINEKINAEVIIPVKYKEAIMDY